MSSAVHSEPPPGLTRPDDPNPYIRFITPILDEHAPRQARAAALALAADCGLDPATSELLRLAASELVTNALLHAAPTVEPPRSPVVSVTLSVQPPVPGRAAAGRAFLVCADNGRGGLRLPDARAAAPERGRGLLALLGSGMRVEQLPSPTIPLPHGMHLHRVAAWCPLQAALRARVCACPCYALGCGTLDPSRRCEEIIAEGTGTRVQLDEAALSYCAHCANSLATLRDVQDTLSGLRLDGTSPVM